MQVRPQYRQRNRDNGPIEIVDESGGEQQPGNHPRALWGDRAFHANSDCIVPMGISPPGVKSALVQIVSKAGRGSYAGTGMPENIRATRISSAANLGTGLSFVSISIET